MIKKALIGLIAVGALSIPLAGMASADPPPDPAYHGNGPGDFGNPPGVDVHEDIVPQPGSVAGFIRDFTGGEFRSPGGLIKAFAPGHN